VEGHGSALLLTNGLTTSTRFWKYTRPRWLERHTVITWDLPGHGASSPARTDAMARVEALPGHIARIMDAAGIERAVQVGWSTGCQVVLELYRQYPQRCTGIGLLFGPAEHVLSTTRLPVSGSVIALLVAQLPAAAFRLTYRGLCRTLQTPGRMQLARWLDLIGPGTSARDVREVIDHMATVDPRTLQTLLGSLQAHSGRSVLRELTVPLTILAGDTDPFAPTSLVGEPLRAAARDAELVRLPHGTHTALLEEPEVIADSVERLMTRAHAQLA
jgi:pimeloyl-ACP methyl ester carboxylesterase